MKLVYRYNWVGVQWVMHHDPSQNLEQDNSPLLGSGTSKVWKVVWGAVLWSLWTHRNGIIFKGHHLDFNVVVELIQYRARAWISTYWKKATFSFYEFYSNHAYCMKNAEMRMIVYIVVFITEKIVFHDSVSKHSKTILNRL